MISLWYPIGSALFGFLSSKKDIVNEFNSCVLK